MLKAKERFPGTILRKVSENENALLELTKAVNRIGERLVLFQAELPRQIAAIGRPE